MKSLTWLVGGLYLLPVCWCVQPATSTEYPVAAISTSAEQSATCLADAFTCSANALPSHALDQVRSVDELSDVQPTDWAYQALKSLVEKYGVISGYSDRTFRGNRALTRYEFAATLNAVIIRMEELLANLDYTQLREDFILLRRLQQSFATILAEQQERLLKLEALAGKLETQQFSTTTKLSGQVVLGLTDGSTANATLPARVRLDLNTSFTGRDLLRTQVEVGNNGRDAIAQRQSTRGFNLLGTTGILADGGGLDYVDVLNTAQISKLYYTFQPIQHVTLTVGARLNPRDFVDYNRFANDSLKNFNSSFFMNNPLIVHNQVDRPGGAGAAVQWQLGERSPLVLRALYVAADAGDPQDPQGVFGGRNQGTIELEYSFQTLVTRLQYTSATINGTAINAGGINVEWAFNRQLSLFGRVGVGRYSGFNTVLRQDLSLTPVTWAVGATLREIVIPGSVAGVAIGQPFIEGDLGNATQTNVEVYYSFDLNDRISFSPAFLIVANPNNRDTGTIFEWVVRLVYGF